MLRSKPRLFAIAAFLILAGGVGWIGKMLWQIEQDEAVRNGWQRPNDIVKALNLHNGSVAADLASGTGFFTFKVAAATGSNGRTIANDIRQRPLLVVKLRSLWKGVRNIETVLGDFDNPHLPVAGVDGILVFNAFHEFTESEQMLDHMVAALRPNGRIVIVDRHPPAGHENDRPAQEEHHHIKLATVLEQLDRRGLRIALKDEAFIRLQDAASDVWWIVAVEKR